MKFVAHANGHKHLTPKDHICSVGLDHLISRNPPKQYEAVKARRREHTRLVLKAQKWLKQNGANCPEDLARLSEASSLKARERSHKVAVLISAIEK